MSVNIKICGLKSESAVAAALSGGASHIGFIFFAKSPRHVEPGRAGELRQAASGRAKAVAVTVDATDDALDAIVAGMAPDMLQLHGGESPARVAEVKARYGLPIMKALSIGDATDLLRVKPYVGIADRFLFDAKPPKGSDLPGGNGVSFDWELLGAVPPEIDYMLSGGLNAANIGDALRLARPRGVDVSSGVENAPGIKDPALIRGFFAALDAACTNSTA